MDAADFEAAGLYDPSAPGAEDRLGLLLHLDAQGVPIDAMRAADAVGSLHAAGSDAAVRPGAPRSIDQVAAAAGLSVELLRRVVIAAGLQLRDDDFRESDEHTFRLFAIGAELFGDEPTLRFTRAMGSSLGTVAEAAISLFLVSLEDPMVRQGTAGAVRAKATESAVEALVEIPAVMDGLFRGHVEQAIRRQRASSDYGEAPSAFRLAIGFVDLVGYTPLAREMAPGDLGELIEEFEMTANEIVSQCDGRVVKHIGDEVMFAAVDAANGARIARDLVDAFDRMAGVAPHAGLGYGVVLGRGGDYYGAVVNTASRIADIAVPNEILVTEDVVAAAASDPELRFEPAGRRQLKGFDEPIALWSLS